MSDLENKQDRAPVETSREIPAIVKTGAGAGSVELQLHPVRELGSGEVLIEVVAAGVCGTDLHIIEDEYASAPPVTMGHEIAGRVVAAAPDVDPAWLDKRVAIETFFSTCETCDQCRGGRRNLCAERRSIGSFADGGFATHVVVPAMNLHEVPQTVSDRAAALCEPLACVCRCLLDPPIINSGDQVLVCGPGPMGLLSAQVARVQGGVVTIAGLAKDAERLAVAEEVGSTASTDPPLLNSFDVVIECSGSAGGAAACLAAARPFGRYVAIGIFGKPVTVDLDAVLLKELTVSSGFASTPNAWRRAMSLLAHQRIDLERLVGRAVGLEQWSSVFEELRSGLGLKTVFIPNQGQTGSSRLSLFE